MGAVALGYVILDVGSNVVASGVATDYKVGLTTFGSSRVTWE